MTLLAWAIVFFVATLWCLAFEWPGPSSHSMTAQFFAAMLFCGAPATALLWALKAIFMP
jgi:hypothetical protein